MKIKEHTVKQWLESYGEIYLDYEGCETNEPKPMTFKQAKYLARVYCGFVVTLPA